MAQKYWTPDAANENLNPPGWRVQFGSVGLNVEIDANSTPYVAISYLNNSTKLVAIDDLDGFSLSGTGDVEIFAQYYHTGNGIDFRTFGRVTGTQKSDGNGAGGGLEGSQFKGTELTNGSDTNFAQLAASPTTETLINQRVNITGDVVKARWWFDSNSEPGMWEFETTRSGVETSGVIGFYGYGNANHRVYAIGVGTNGDPAPTSAPSGVSGTVAQTTPAITQAATAKLVYSGSLIQTLPAFTQAAEALQTFSGAMAQSLPAFTQDAGGGVTYEAVVSQSMPVMTQTMTGALQFSGEMAQTLPTLEQSASGFTDITGTAAQTLPAMTQQATGTGGDFVPSAVLMPLYRRRRRRR